MFDRHPLRTLGEGPPITVRRVRVGYSLIAGERRYRAHRLLEATTIRAIVHEPADIADLRVMQIIENDQRVDVTPLEAGGHLGASQAFEMSRLSPRGQDVLFRATKEGRCKT